MPESKEVQAGDVFTSSQCSCLAAPTEFNLEDFVDKPELSEVKRRREAEYKQHLASCPLQLILAQPNSPLMYPIQGVRVLPLQETSIPGLSVYAPKKTQYQVSLSVTKGVLATTKPGRDDHIEGQNEMVLTISTSNLERLNHLLRNVTYTSTLYRIKDGDLVSFTFEKHSATFPIVIEQPLIPHLYDPGQGISSQVTIVTKTFLRYPQLDVLIKSIRTFYKDMTILVADDSINPKKINGSNIEQYIMPPAKGWFAGRNLVVSQVSTKYLLWVDDDFLFTGNTEIEKLVEVMEAMPELDVVGGSVTGNTFTFQLVYGEGEDGHCVSRRMGHYQPIPSFPDCVLTSGVVNFFLARTDSVRKVGFDPRLQRVAHTEFFVDGLGSLLVASCSKITIDHQPRTQEKLSEEEKAAQELYRTFRTPKQEEVKMKLGLHFFKNRMKCFSSN
nr:PREDICTED: beta-1,4 N-acetylgalactosaminyltransferase 2 [Lepisosteus oculatus]